MCVSVCVYICMNIYTHMCIYIFFVRFFSIRGDESDKEYIYIYINDTYKFFHTILQMLTYKAHSSSDVSYLNCFAIHFK